MLLLSLFIIIGMQMSTMHLYALPALANQTLIYSHVEHKLQELRLVAMLNHAHQELKQAAISNDVEGVRATVDKLVVVISELVATAESLHNQELIDYSRQVRAQWSNIYNENFSKRQALNFTKKYAAKMPPETALKEKLAQVERILSELNPNNIEAVRLTMDQLITVVSELVAAAESLHNQELIDYSRRVRTQWNNIYNENYSKQQALNFTKKHATKTPLETAMREQLAYAERTLNALNPTNIDQVSTTLKQLLPLVSELNAVAESLGNQDLMNDTKRVRAQWHRIDNENSSKRLISSFKKA